MVPPVWQPRTPGGDCTGKAENALHPIQASQRGLRLQARVVVHTISMPLPASASVALPSSNPALIHLARTGVLEVWGQFKQSLTQVGGAERRSKQEGLEKRKS